MEWVAEDTAEALVWEQGVIFQDAVCTLDWWPLYVTVPSNGEGNGTPLQYSCLENPMEGGAW